MGTLSELRGTKWTGPNELWLDPLGNDVVTSDGTMRVDDDVVRYTWSHEGKTHEGSVTLREGGADFRAPTPIGAGVSAFTCGRPESSSCR